MAYVNKTGLPSVTTIIKPYIDTTWFTDEHSERGTLIHDCCAAYLKDDWMLPEIPITWQGYFDSFKRWADSSIDKVISVEERLSDYTLRYCGQYDFVGTLKGSNKRVLMDWKTSQAYQSWFPLQTAAYRRLYQQHYSLDIDDIATVRLKANGTGCIIDYSTKDYFNVFLGLLNAHHFFNN